MTKNTDPQRFVKELELLKGFYQMAQARTQAVSEYSRGIKESITPSELLDILPQRTSTDSSMSSS